MQEQTVVVLAIIKIKVVHPLETTKWQITHMAIILHTITAVLLQAIALKLAIRLLSFQKKADDMFLFA